MARARWFGTQYYEVTSLTYPPPGAYVFRYSLSSAAGDWKASKAYRTGMSWNTIRCCRSAWPMASPPNRYPRPLLLLGETRQPGRHALKKSDLGPSILLRVYEIEGASVKTPVEFLGCETAFNETNLLEEDQATSKQPSLQAGPYSIKTLKLAVTAIFRPADGP